MPDKGRAAGRQLFDGNHHIPIAIRSWENNDGDAQG
jgi:hypothetical protein